MNKHFGIILFSILGMLLIFAIAGCSSESDTVSQQTKKTGVTKQTRSDKASELAYSYDHPHDETVTDMEKHKFQHQFADQCVKREINSYPQAKQNKKTLQKTCMCIAEYMMKDLTAVEAEKFLHENKNPRSLQIRFNNATYFCAKK
ncbi:MAG TPA: hypothetical protein ENJ32_11205 [Crenotrichaceae bacterium]|nr:hypothetical protein [Crenotrichaceae bacterium]